MRDEMINAQFSTINVQSRENEHKLEKHPTDGVLFYYKRVCSFGLVRGTPPLRGGREGPRAACSVQLAASLSQRWHSFLIIILRF